MAQLERKTIAVRADASPSIGVGHVARCVALAEAWIDLGGDAILIASGARPVLDALAGDIPLCWLGSDAVDLSDDGARFLAAAREAGATVAAIDSYRHSKAWETVVRRAGLTVLAVDDLASRPHDCDFILDTSIAADEGGRYGNLVPDDAVRLLGPSYVLLRRTFRKDWFRPRSARPVGRLMVSFGGADLQDRASAALDAIARVGMADMTIDVVVSSASPHLAALRRRAAAYPGIRLHVDTPDVAQLMAAADLAIGAAGGSAWERCRAGLPTLIVKVADNQRGIAERLRASGVVRMVPGDDAAFVANLAQALSAALADGEWRSGASRRAMELIDGGGAHRVASQLMQRASVPSPA
jgi:UDP-2,4-diacetamido-2,4,6-trideoxy-beta-L-altropyranose hydrolase